MVSAVSAVEFFCYPTITASSESIMKGNSVTFSGTISYRPNALEGNKILIYKRDSHRKATTTLIGTIYTNQYGRYTFKYSPIRTADYKAVCIGKISGDDTYKGSSWIRVLVYPYHWL